MFEEHCEEKNLTSENILKILKRTSKYYGAFIGVNQYYNTNIMEHLSAFYKIKQTTILPLIFKIFGDYEEKNIDEKTLCNVLDYLLTYLIRLNVCEINKNLSKFFKSIYFRVISDGNYDKYYEKFVAFLNDLKAVNRMPTDREFQDALVYKPLYKKPICKYVLSVIENSTKEHINIDNLTIEHILPQKENAAVWKAEVGSEYRNVYEVYLHTLGNLTITGHNSELGTKPFDEKKKIIRENSKANILNKNVLSADKWNKESIIRRAEELSNIFINQFDYVDIHTDVSEMNEFAFGVDSGIDFSNTKPAGFLFLGEYTKVSSWIDLLSEFMRLSYDLSADTIKELANNDYVISNANNVYISNDKRKLRKEKQIGNSGIFFESNLSSNNIVSFVKALLLKMELDTDDFLIFLSEMPFDIKDETTWKEEMLPVAKLFYNLIEDLILNHKIDATEVEKL